jgi:hypothetical protein
MEAKFVHLNKDKKPSASIEMKFFRITAGYAQFYNKKKIGRFESRIS